jgi:hypothetical protein
MIKKQLAHTLFVCLLAMPIFSLAQTVDRAELLDKTWYFVAVKCDKMGSPDQFIRYYESLKLATNNPNITNYGWYERVYRDQRDNPKEFGTFALNVDETNGLVLTLKKRRTGEATQYKVVMVEANHLTLFRIDGSDKCRTSYAIAP